MSKRAVAVAVTLAVTVIVLSVPVAIRARTAVSQGPASDLVVHEWGTFTSVAGPNGQAQQWTPLGGQADLPCFVESFQNREVKVLVAPTAKPLDPRTVRTQLRATVRMETPVLYFYTREATTVDVSVRFPQGLFTEWYPTAFAIQPLPTERLFAANTPTNATMAWSKVALRPDARADFPTESAASHYYAARDTDAVPVEVNGKRERFLFYRGVAGFAPPIAASLRDGQLVVTNLGADPIPGVIVFSNDGRTMGFKAFGTLGSEATYEMPRGASTMAALKAELESTLVAQGLYAKEAHAMVETWRDSWFEEGTRLFYVMPKPAVDATLPLTVTPAPAAVTRVFVGRVEVITPTMVEAVEYAVAENDTDLLDRYGRLLGPIGERIVEQIPSAEQRSRILGLLDARLKSYVDKLNGCR